MRYLIKSVLGLKLLLLIFTPSIALFLGENKYKSIRSLIESQNIERAFEEIKAAQAKTKLSGYALLSMGHIYLELALPVKASKNFEKYYLLQPV